MAPATGRCRPIADADYCVACRHNRTVPDLSVAGESRALAASWRSPSTGCSTRCSSWACRMPTKGEDEAQGLAFDFLADPTAPTRCAQGDDRPRQRPDHDRLAEADDAERERRRTALGEPYRTLLGHLRHEVGHYYWDRLVADARRVRRRSAPLFGDERADYGEALQAPLRQAAVGRLAGQLSSAPMRAAHPWEDFAETWAHYLHIIDTLETARAFRVRVDPEAAKGERPVRRGRLRRLPASMASSRSSTRGCRCRSRSTA